MSAGGDFAAAREAELVAEAEGWDMSRIRDATPGEIPVIDVGRFFADGDARELERLAGELREVGEQVGFHLLVGHGIEVELIDAVFEQAAAFLTADESVKRPIEIDRPDAPVPGIGWLPVGERRLPRRAKGNLNEAILFKRDRAHRLADNLWPDPDRFPRFRSVVSQYAAEIERVASGLLPLHARALDLPADWFAAAFRSPFYRLRMTRYEPVTGAASDEYGIAPHVDTTFITLLAQSGPGLVIRGGRDGSWLRVPMVPGSLVVNTGELLKQWSNDRFVSVKHFVPPHGGPDDRYSVPFFFNATADHPMVCLPTCTGPDNPPRYPPVSYLDSQAAAQGE